MAKQIGPLAKRETIAAIIRACHRTSPQIDRSGNPLVHYGEYDAADKIMDLDADDHK